MLCLFIHFCRLGFTKPCWARFLRSLRACCSLHTCLTTSLVAGQFLTHPSALPESSSLASPTWISPKHPISTRQEIWLSWSLFTQQSLGAAVQDHFAFPYYSHLPVTLSLRAHEACGLWGSDCSPAEPFPGCSWRNAFAMFPNHVKHLSPAWGLGGSSKGFTGLHFSFLQESFIFLFKSKLPNTLPSLSDFPHQLSSHIHVVLVIILLVSHPASLSYSILLPKLPAFICAHFNSP